VAAEEPATGTVSAGSEAASEEGPAVMAETLPEGGEEELGSEKSALDGELPTEAAPTASDVPGKWRTPTHITACIPARAFEF
jgi:hypothetical protein